MLQRTIYCNLCCLLFALICCNATNQAVERRLRCLSLRAYVIVTLKCASEPTGTIYPMGLFPVQFAKKRSRAWRPT